MVEHDGDVLIVGGGVAGLTLALEIAGTRRVTLLRPAQDDPGASQWAQGGIAAVLSPQDRVDDHVHDTLVAGAGLCDEAAVRFTVAQGPATIDWLLSLGVPFTPDTSHDAAYPYHLTREGGHGARRVIHADDATGRALVDTLLSHVRRHPAIDLYDDLTAIALIGDLNGHCRGVHCLDLDARPHALLARDTILATGGASGLYLHTTSPGPACGEGMVMAAELGADLMNLEFQQFHPTCLYDPRGQPFLISEAVRGEGGILRNLAGERFMPDLDPRAELAPRDIVARAIDTEMQNEGGAHVWLDVTHLPATAIRRHFPTIHAHCLTRGLDITRQPIPVVPAAHYSCGGVATDLSGASRVPHLYAIGETACTGLHGANRMASNSLLECLVFARAAANALRTSHAKVSDASPAIPPASSKASANDAEIDGLMGEVRQLMSRWVGIVRHDAGLDLAAMELRRLHGDCQALWQRHAPSVALAQLRHAVSLASLTVRAARDRRESRGLHFNRDCPSSDDSPGRPSHQRLGFVRSVD